VSDQNIQPLDKAVEETMDLAHQAIEQTRAEIARSQALSQVEADLVQSIERILDKYDGLVPGDNATSTDTAT
jgi:hypothetical protein